MSDNFITSINLFESSDTINNISYCVWTPNCAPRAIIQIVHGMCERIERYDEFAQFLVSKGFVVCGHDQLGHGYSVKSDEDLGFFADSDGDRFLLEDVEKLRKIMRDKYRLIPYFLLGHGLGSFVARAYASAYPSENIDGLIISGTFGDKMHTKAKMATARIISAIKGKRYRSRSLYKLAFGFYGKHLKNDTENGSWITSSKELLDKYSSDKLCNFRPTAQAYCDMLMLINYNKTHLPHRSIPILIFSGADDPVGNYGLEVNALYEKYFESEISDVSFKLYENERHGVLIGSNRHEAFTDVVVWIDKVIDAKIELINQKTLSFNQSF